MKICRLSMTHTFTKSFRTNGGYGPIILKVAQSPFIRWLKLCSLNQSMHKFISSETNFSKNLNASIVTFLHSSFMWSF